MTKEQLQIELDLLMDDVNRVAKQIELFDATEKKNRMLNLQHKCFKRVEDDSTEYFCTNKLVIDTDGYDSPNLYLIAVKFFADSKLLHECELDEEYLENLTEISKEEFLIAYNKVINYYNTLINGN